MVELEYDDVSFAAVNARMVAQVLDEFRNVLRTTCRAVRDQPRLLRVAVLSVVALVVLREALPTPRLSQGRAGPSQWELIEWLRLTAA